MKYELMTSQTALSNQSEISTIDNRDAIIVDLIEKFLNQSDLTPSTNAAYRNDIRKFFSVADVSQITFDMIIDVDNDKAQEFFDNSSDDLATKERMRSTMSALYNFINTKTANNRNRQVLFQFIPFKGLKLTGDKKSYGALSNDEVIALFEKGMDIDVLYWEILIRSGVRSEAIRMLNVYDNIKEVDGWKVAYGTDKGKEYDFPMSDELYERCVAVADCDGYVFASKFGHCTALKRFKDALTRIGLSEQEIGKDGRYLTLHSLRKVSGDKANEIFKGDIVKVKDHLRHADITYTGNLYMNKAKRDYSKDASVVMEFKRNDSASVNDVLRELLRDNDVKYEVREVLLGLGNDAKKEIIDGLRKFVREREVV